MLWWTIFNSSKLTFGEKLIFFTSYFSSISFLSWIVVFLVAVNVGMLVYFIRQKRELLKSGGVTGFLGLAFGAIGSGCVACGSVILSVLGLTGVAAFLPFGGRELSWISIGLLLLSIYLLNKGIRRGGIDKKVCSDI